MRDTDVAPERPILPVDDHREAPRRLLVVDDTTGNRYAVVRMLSAEGFVVDEAETGAEALARAHEGPELIVLDVKLPDMSGYDVVRQLKSDPQTAMIPVLHLSASYAGAADRAHGLEQGADGYLTHPVEPIVLAATVRALLRLRDADAKIRAAASEWSATFDAISTPVFLLDEQSRVLRANRAAVQLFEAEHGSPIGQVLPELFASASDPSVVFDTGAWRTHGAPEGALLIGDRYYTLALSALLPPHAGALRRVCVMSDATARLEHERERDALLRSAEEARATAEAASQSKSEFLATMSHEFRTPLNALIGYSDLLDLGIAGPLNDMQRQYVGRITGSGRHLLTLVNDVLDLARVDAGRLEVAHEPRQVQDAVTAAVTLVRPQAVTRNIALGEECDGSGEAAYIGDEDRVRQILVNLLSNAVKFTAPGGRVSLSCTLTRDVDPVALLPERKTWVAIRVHDTGIGIAAEHVVTVFDAFMQANPGRTRSHGGAGLGLTISRNLARLMGGDLTVTSQLGKGSTFTLWLPAYQPPSSESNATPVEGHLPLPEAADLELHAHLAEASAQMLLAAGEITTSYVERLRSEDGVTSAAGLDVYRLRDHAPTVIAELATNLSLLARAGDRPVELVRDTVAIQRLVSGLHGAQRHRLGWSEEQLRRDTQLLGEAVQASLARSLEHAPPALEVARRAAAQFLEHWAQGAMRGYRFTSRTEGT